jgi:hypothetical protein
MSNKTFDCVEQLVEPQGPVMWPSEIYDVLTALGDEDPLRGPHKRHEFLKSKFHLGEKTSKKLRGYQLLRTQSKRRRVRISQGNAGVMQMDLPRRLNHYRECRIVNWLLRLPDLANIPPG